MSFWESISNFFDFGGGTPGSSDTGFGLDDLLKAGINVGGNLLLSNYANKAQQEAAQANAEAEIANQLKLQEELIKLKQKYGLLGGGGGGGGGGAGMYAAQTQRAATLAGLYNEMAKQRLLGAAQTGEAYRGLGAAAQTPLLARSR